MHATEQSRLAREVARWLDPCPPSRELDGLVLARLVSQEVGSVGKQFLRADLLERLSAVRDLHGGRDRRLDAFLECVLDKHDGRFWNRTYLSLPLLEVVQAEHDLAPSRLAALLAADVVRHELGAAVAGTEVSPLGRPDPRTLRTRVRHALRFAASHLGLPAPADVWPAVAGEPDPALTDLLDRLPAAPAAEWLELTVLPVSTVHDEYFFVRVLQAHELACAGMARRMRAATAAVRGRQLGVATGLLREVVAFMDRHASLFRIVATMRPEAFHTFREFTDGASAVQSEQYKRFEALCGTPPASRLRSPAYESVPAVRAEVRAGQDTMTDAFRDACASGGDQEALAYVGGLLRRLEDSHRRWKRTHLTLASRMLGDARGSGDTAGAEYLRRWVDHRLFWALPELATGEATRSA